MTRSATFIDYENISLQAERALREDRSRSHSPAGFAATTIRLIELGLERIEERFDFSMIVARAFADWDSVGHHNVQQGLTLRNIRPVYALGKRGRSSVDIELSLAAQRVLLLRPEIDAFIFLSGDRSCIPVISEVLDAGKEVVVASMRSSISGDLVKLLGEHRVFSLDDAFVDLSGARAETPDEEQEPLVEPEEDGSALPDEVGHLDEAHQERFATLVEQAIERYPRGVWLGPFFKNYMNEEFGSLNNEQRKELVDLARKKGRIRIRYVEDESSVNGGYSVLESTEEPTPAPAEAEVEELTAAPEAAAEEELSELS